MVLNPATDPEGRKEPTLTLDGWRSFVGSSPTFTLLPMTAWQALSPSARAAYDDARVNYHSDMVIVATSTVEQVTKQGRLLTLLNRNETGARRGMIVSGPQTSGKTTAIKELGRTHELRVRSRYPGQDRIPVVDVTTPPKGSPKQLTTELANFLGPPILNRRFNTVEVTSAVCRVLIDARCELVLIDEIHNLNLATAPGADMSDHLKYFTEHLSATFVYAGIDVKNSGLFDGLRGKQIEGRCVLLNTTAFPRATEWKALIATMESAIRLYCHQQGTLTDMAEYLHKRTGGMIGSLSHLIRLRPARDPRRRRSDHPRAPRPHPARSRR